MDGQAAFLAEVDAMAGLAGGEPTGPTLSGALDRIATAGRRWLQQLYVAGVLDCTCSLLQLNKLSLATVACRLEQGASAEHGGGPNELFDSLLCPLLHLCRVWAKQASFLHILYIKNA